MSKLEFPDIMVDIETTGVDKNHCAIIQIAAVKFNLAEGTIDHRFFNQSLDIAPNRFWEESCRTWWSKMPAVLNDICSRMRDPQTVLQEFTSWSGPNASLWGKPTHFDYSFLESYYKAFGMQIPFHYRYANDMNSFIRGAYFPAEQPNYERELPFVGEKHNAIHDALHQIKVLFKVREDILNAKR